MVWIQDAAEPSLSRLSLRSLFPVVVPFANHKKVKGKFLSCFGGGGEDKKTRISRYYSYSEFKLVDLSRFLLDALLPRNNPGGVDC